MRNPQSDHQLSNMKFLVPGGYVIVALFIKMGGAIAFELPVNLHEKSLSHKFMDKAKFVTHPEFRQMKRAQPQQSHEVIFAVEQKNIDLLTKHLMDVSFPEGKNYGRYWDHNEVAQLTSNPTSSTEIQDFLADVGATIVNITKHGEYIRARGSVQLWETVFNTEFYDISFVDDVSPREITRSLEYSLPVRLVNHVAGVFNTVQLGIGSRNSPMQQHVSTTGMVTPSLLNHLYDIRSNQGHPSATQGVYESLGQTKSLKDLAQFQSLFHLPSQSFSKIIGGHVEENCPKNIFDCIEANLDVS